VRRSRWIYLAVGMAAFAAPVSAHAAVSCVFGGGTATVSMSAAGDSGSLAVGTGANAGRIMVGAAACGAATVTNTDTIVVNGNTGAETITIDLSGGPFGPGVAVEGSGTSEIEFAIDLSTGVQDRLTVTGTSGAESVGLGTLGANLNGDNDVDATLTGVELGTVNASDGADLVSGAGGAVTGSATSLLLTVTGDAGNDTLTGGTGDDTITGGTGNNVLSGGGGDDTVTGGSGDDTIAGDAGGDSLTGGLGNDVFDEGAAINGTDTMAGSGGNDLVTYGGRASGVVVTMDGVFDDGEPGEADNVAADVENAIGGAGANTMVGSGNANVLTGGPVADVIDGAGGDDTIAGGIGGDRLTGGAGNDVVSGGADGDWIFEGAGSDDLDGGPDSDTLDYSGVAASVVVSLADAAPQTTGGAGTDTLAGFENLTGGTGADTLAGDAGPNVLSGNSGNDTILGDDGDDAINGDVGTDTVDYSSYSGAVTVVLGPAAGPTPGTSTGAAGTDSLLRIENVTGGSGDDSLTGEAGANVLFGGAGEDVLAGLRANDTLDGDAGADTLDYSAADSGITLNLASLAAQNTGGAGTDTVLNAENVVGSPFADALTGTVGANSLQGGAGDDSLSGAAGDDALDGAGGTDMADYSAAAFGITVDLSLTTPQDTRAAGVDTLTALENLTGGAGRDELTGSTAANTIAGGAGNDVLRATAGDDVLDGGAGADRVDYSARPPGVAVNLTEGRATSSGATDLLVAVENATGGSGADLLTGDGNINILEGGSGDDRLRGFGNADVLDGGIGTDTADYSAFYSANRSVGVIVDLSAGHATGDGADSLAGIENVRGSSFDDSIAGDGQANRLSGGDGRDTITGRGGNDLLLGGDGADFFAARDGLRDRVYGGPGRDRARVDRRDIVRGVAVLLP
jgi:Ca2+-binding RTX toxin-like protein